MKIIEPTHKEIMQYLNCCYYSYWNKRNCECHDKNQFKECYAKAKERLTKKVYTEEEIKKSQEQNAEAMEELNKILHEIFD